METMKIRPGKSKEQFEEDHSLMIPLTRPYFDEEKLEEIRDVLDSGWVSQGPKTKEFEDVFAKCSVHRHVAAIFI